MFIVPIRNESNYDCSTFLFNYSSLKDEFDSYQASVKQKNDPDVAPTAPTQDAVCQICHKTKFADGIGHKCHYCGVRSCARCGGKIALRSNKVSL